MLANEKVVSQSKYSHKGLRAIFPMLLHIKIINELSIELDVEASTTVGELAGAIKNEGHPSIAYIVY